MRVNNKEIMYLFNETDLGSNLPEAKILSNKELESKYGKLPKFAFNKYRTNIAEVVLQEVDERNRNGRWYDKRELFPEIKASRTTELLAAGNLRSESGHPLSKDIARQQTIVKSNCSAIILKLWTEGNYIKALVRGTNNKLGQEFDEDLSDGISPSWSLRALGSVETTKRGAEVKNIRVITWDEVIYPSHPRAYTKQTFSIATESAVIDKDNDKGMMLPILTNQLKDCLQHESMSYNRLLESGFVFDAVYLDEGYNNVTMVESTGNTVILPLEDHLRNTIMDFCDR